MEKEITEIIDDEAIDFDFTFDESKKEEKIVEETHVEEVEESEETSEEIETKKETIDTTVEYEHDTDSIFLDVLKQEDYLILLDDEGNDVSSKVTTLTEALDLHVRNINNIVIQKIYEKAGEEGGVILKAIIDDGITKPSELLKIFADATTADKFITVTEDNAETIMRNYYKNNEQFDDEEIEEMIQNLILKDKLQNYAERIAEKQNKQIQQEQQEKIQKEQQRQIAEKQQREREILQQTEEMKSTVESRKWDKKVKAQVVSELTSGATNDKLIKLLSNPQAAPDLAMLLTRIYKETKKDGAIIDLSGLEDLAKSAIGKKITEKYAENLFSNKGKTTQSVSKQVDWSNDFEF
jgi:hypothetical protein